MSHFNPPAVQRDMMKSLKTAIVILPSTTLLFVLSACGPVVDVLHDADAGAATGGSAATNGTNGTLTTGGAGATNGTPTTGGASSPTGTPTTGGSVAASICTAISPSKLDAVTPGQACSNLEICEPGGCASMASSTDSTAAAFATCRNGQAQVITMTALDVPSTGSWTARNDGIIWTDCDAALATGLSGQSCTFAGKSCVRPSTDSCCIEGLACAAVGGTSGILERVRICSPECKNLVTDNTLPVVSDCASAASTDMCHKTAPCSGNFICWGMLGSDQPIAAYTQTDSLNGAIWCAGGALVGGYSYAWGI